MDWVARAISNYGERIVIGLDIRGRDLLGRGSKVLIKDFASSIRTLNSLGAPRYVVTDVEKDGSLSGPSLDLLDEVLQLTERPVVWSGGVSTLEQLELLRARTSAGLEGVIIGKAFYEGELSFPEALGVCSN
jgi:phosphoribosylformimino-5-aminoimidazole carboxamide ribotide isomerase/phosphoribosylanthranilate isomerase